MVNEWKEKYSHLEAENDGLQSLMERKSLEMMQMQEKIDFLSNDRKVEEIESKSSDNHQQTSFVSVQITFCLYLYFIHHRI